MARPRFVMEWAAEDTEEGLKERYRREERADVRMRLHGLWLLRTGRAVRETAAAVGVHRRTVDRWVDWYRTGGVTEVISHHQGGRGRPPRLTAEQEEQVRAEVATGRFLPHGSRDRPVDREHRQRRVLAGGSDRSPAPAPGRAHGSPSSPRQSRPCRARGVEKGGLAAALTAVGMEPGQTVGHLDEMRLGLVGTTRRRWGVQGVKVVQPVQRRYEWRYLVVLVDGEGGRLWWTWQPTMKATALQDSLGRLRQESRIGAVVWDGAPAHRSHAVRAASPPRVERPPYSPELNPAERLFEVVRRHVVGAVYATLAHKQAAVETYLRALAADPARVRSLTGWDWIGHSLEQLAS